MTPKSFELLGVTSFPINGEAFYLELQIRPMGVVVGEKGIGVGNLDM